MNLTWVAASVVLQESPGDLQTSLTTLIEIAALLIEVLAVAIIVIATVVATVVFVRQLLRRAGGLPGYEQYKVRLGRALLLGLEILVAADIVRTVALEPSMTNIAILGLLVLIRTFLSWSLVVEIEHRWPWRAPKEVPVAASAVADQPGSSPREEPHG